MLFVEFQFLVFFAIVLLVYWSLPGNELRKWYLLACSYYFYGSWDWRFAIMLFVLSSADYFFARFIDTTSSQNYRKLWVTMSVAMNLTVLGFFKYFNFFIDSAISLANSFGTTLSEPTLNIILPVGISFFTFQSLSYTIDVYRKEIPAAQNMRDYLLFAAFFPQLVAGPIVRPRYFLPQLVAKRSVTPREIKWFLALFLLGYLKKAGIADNISPYVDRVFESPDLYSNFSSVIAVWLYTIQIYCDFSGYSDMAIAVAGLMGYALVLNFDAPYLVTSIQDFWRRWHISLSTWIRDYIYISLGGREKSLLRTYRNLVITMLAGGLWHGAAWTFVAWGGAHGMALVVNQEFRRWFPLIPTSTRLRKAIGWILTMQFVCMTWILFRAPDFETVLVMTKHYLLLDRGGDLFIPLWLGLIAPGLLVIQYLMRRYMWQTRLVELPLSRFAFVYGAIWALAIAMLPLGYRPFIYFQF